jgi:hypothetical protein
MHHVAFFFTVARRARLIVPSWWIGVRQRDVQRIGVDVPWSAARRVLFLPFD